MLRHDYTASRFKLTAMAVFLLTFGVIFDIFD